MSKIILNTEGSYIDFPKLLKNKKGTVIPKDQNNRFKYTVTVSLHHQKIPNNSPSVNNIGPFNKMYDCKEINFPSDQKYWEKFNYWWSKMALYCSYKFIGAIKRG